MVSEQVVRVSPRTTAFTAVCDACAEGAAEPGWAGASFAGRLDLDLETGMFLCRQGHTIRVERAGQAASSVSTEAA